MGRCEQAAEDEELDRAAGGAGRAPEKGDQRGIVLELPVVKKERGGREREGGAVHEQQQAQQPERFRDHLQSLTVRASRSSKRPPSRAGPGAA